MKEDKEIKEWWLNIYDYDHNPCMFHHESRELARKKSMYSRKLLYRIHVRLK